MTALEGSKVTGGSLKEVEGTIGEAVKEVWSGIKGVDRASSCNGMTVGKGD